MRQLISITVLLFSCCGFSQELVHTFGNTTCIVTKDKAVKNYNYKNFTFSETKEIKVSELQEFILKAYENSRNTPFSEIANVEARINDKVFNLNIKDSQEALLLIQLATTICK